MTVMKVYIDHELVFDREKEKRSVVEALNLVLFSGGVEDCGTGDGYGDGCSQGTGDLVGIEGA